MEDEEKEKEKEAGVEPAAEQDVAPHTPLSASDQAGAMALEAEAVLFLEPPPAPTPRQMLQPLDITPFVR